MRARCLQGARVVKIHLYQQFFLFAIKVHFALHFRCSGSCRLIKHHKVAVNFNFIAGSDKSEEFFPSENFFLRKCRPNAQILGAAQLLPPFLSNPSAFGFLLSKICCSGPAGCLLQLHISGNGKTKGFWCERPSSAAEAAASRTAPPLSPLITQHSATAAYIQFHTAAKKNIFRWVIVYRTS